MEQLISQGRLSEAVAAYRKQPVPALLTRLGEVLLSGRGLEMLELYQAYLLVPPSVRWIVSSYPRRPRRSQEE